MEKPWYTKKSLVKERYNDEKNNYKMKSGPIEKKNQYY